MAAVSALLMLAATTALADGGAPVAMKQDSRSITFTPIFNDLPGLLSGSAAWGDYDNDGDLDVLLMGSVSLFDVRSVVCRNDGGGVFTDIAAGLIGVHRSSGAWGDYDNDGDLDILLSGTTAFPPQHVCRVYRNDGGGVFTDVAAGGAGASYGSVAWGDYDNDGDLDILLTGSSGSARISRIYRNNDGIFSDVNAGLTGVDRSCAAWGDYDNDGDLDILMTGDTGAALVSRVYRNDGGTYTDINAGLPGVRDGAAAWGDYDNDSMLDVLLTGDTGAGLISRVYRNGGGGVFTDIGAGLLGVFMSAVSWETTTMMGT